MSPQLEVLGPKDHELVIPFCLGEVEVLPKFHLRSLTIRSELDLLQDQTGKINNLTRKQIMELSKLKHLQRYMPPFEIDYRSFERQPQGQQLSLTLNPEIEEIFETLETEDIDMISSHSIIETIVKLILSIHSNVRMYQIRVNRPTKTPVNSTNSETIVNSTNTETLVNSINSETLVNSINIDPFKYPFNTSS